MIESTLTTTQLGFPILKSVMNLGPKFIPVFRFLFKYDGKKDVIYCIRIAFSCQPVF